MTPAQKKVLLVIAEKGPVSAGGIATDRFGHPGYALRTERVCVALADQGLVEHRRSGWRLTTGGRRRLAEISASASN